MLLTSDSSQVRRGISVVSSWERDLRWTGELREQSIPAHQGLMTLKTQCMFYCLQSHIRLRPRGLGQRLETLCRCRLWVGPPVRAKFDHCNPRSGLWNWIYVCGMNELPRSRFPCQVIKWMSALNTARSTLQASRRKCVSEEACQFTNDFSRHRSCGRSPINYLATYVGVIHLKLSSTHYLFILHFSNNWHHSNSVPPSRQPTASTTARSESRPRRRSTMCMPSESRSCWLLQMSRTGSLTGNGLSQNLRLGGEVEHSKLTSSIHVPCFFRASASRVNWEYAICGRLKNHRLGARHVL